MNAIPASREAVRLGCALALLGAAATLAQADTPGRSVRAVPPPVSHAGVAGAGSAAPSPSGLPSQMPSPAGLTSQFPAGLPSPLPSPQGLTSQFPAGLPSPLAGPVAPTPPVLPDVVAPSTPVGGRPVYSRPQSSIMGAGGYGGSAAAQEPQGAAGGPYTALQIAQSFLGADANRDGELTPAEARHLTIMPYSFEEMDRNHDGILTRSEYEDAVR